MANPSSPTQAQSNDLFDRKMAVTQLLMKMQRLKNHTGKPYRQCQEQIWQLTHPHADKDAEVEDDA